MKRPAVSVILPTFNRLAFLRPAVDSVLAQTCSDWQLVIADDGSGPETAAYLATLANPPRIRVLELAHSGSPAAVRNAALSAASGDYVAFLDSDDVWRPEKLRRQLALHRERDRCGWSYTAEELIDAAGRTVLTPGARRANVLHEGAIFEALLTLEASLSTPCVMAERRLIEEVGGFDEGLPFFEDYDLWLRLSLRSEVRALSEPLALVRNHGEHYSADRVGVYQARLRLLEKFTAAVTTARQGTILLEERARTSMALARVLAASGRGNDALRSLWRSREIALSDHSWWWAAMYTLALIGAPHWLRASVRRYRARR